MAMLDPLDDFPSDSAEILRYQLVSPITDPSAYTVWFEFVALTNGNTTITWQVGTWQQDPVMTGPWFAAIAVGPGSSVQWTPGVWLVRIKYSNSPETPVIDLQQITVT